MVISGDKNSRFQAFPLWIHLLFWLLYLVSEYFANLIHMRPGETWHFLRSSLLSIPALMFSSYFIAWYVVPKFLKTNKWPIFFLWVVLIGVFIFFARLEWQYWVNYMDYHYTERIPVSKMLKNIIRDYSIVALAVCVSILSDYRKKQVLNEKLAQSKAEAEIRLLKGQLHPHFLFNSLNNIYSLALIKSELTADSILKLTELLDYLIYRVNLDQVPLYEEVSLIENYIGLEKLRHDDRLKLATSFQVLNQKLLVAPLILLPFVENCFKHGSAGADGIFKVKMHLKANEEHLVFHIENDKKNGKASASTSGGLGLQNVRQRLQLLYPGKHELIIRDYPDKFEVDLVVKF